MMLQMGNHLTSSNLNGSECILYYRELATAAGRYMTSRSCLQLAMLWRPNYLPQGQMVGQRASLTTSVLCDPGALQS